MTVAAEHLLRVAAIVVRLFCAVVIVAIVSAAAIGVVGWAR